jgi:hypothetical protein
VSMAVVQHQGRRGAYGKLVRDRLLTLAANGRRT